MPKPTRIDYCKYLFSISSKKQIVRLTIFCTMCICITLFSATVISDNHEDYGHQEETIDFHVQRPRNDIWYHDDYIFDQKLGVIDIPADVEHTHPALTHSHENYWADEDENGERPDFAEHTHAAFTHGPHRKTHARIDAIKHEPHNYDPDELHAHNSTSLNYWEGKDISHVHPEDTSHMGGRAHTHARYEHWHQDGEELHEDHDADGEHTHPPTIVEEIVDSDYNAIPYKRYNGYNGYTHTHTDPAFEAHKAENPPHTDHTSYVEHSHDEATHTHDDFSEHTHAEHSHLHADDIAELEAHKQEGPAHTPHKSFIEHTHSGETHSHDEYPSHTHNGYSHSHADDITELETHKQERQTHTPHKSFVEHTHSGETHFHGDYPSHTHNGYSHSHADDITELETHKQERQTHTPHKSFVEHTHSGETHFHGDYPSHTHNEYSHSHTDDITELENHKTERPSHTTHTSIVEHTHNELTHSHGEYPSHTHKGYTHSHADDITELETHKQQRAAHTPHKSFVEHTHGALTHAHDDFSEHTHAEYSHSHTDDIAELEAHEQQRATHTPHTSFVEHTHSAETHSHGDHPSHTHEGYSHSHDDDSVRLEAHKQQKAPHSAHKDYREHTHEPTTHTHDDFPEHIHAGYTHTHSKDSEYETHINQHPTHNAHDEKSEHQHVAVSHSHDVFPEHTHPGYTHTHSIQPQPEPTPQSEPDPNQQQSEATTQQNTDTHDPQTGLQDDGQQPKPEADPEPNYTIISFDYEREGIGKVVFSELMLARPEKYPQWIELYNTTDQDIDMNGWKIVGRYLDDSNTINILESQVISKSWTIEGKGTVLIVSFTTPNSRDRITKGLADKAYALGSNRKNFWNYEGLVLELQDAEGNPIDRIGNLNEENEIIWEIPMIVREKRISLIRRLKSIRSQEYNFTFGTKEFGWFPAEKVKRLTEERNQYFYGRYTDIGAPGYRTEDGVTLPVTLSSFRAQLTKNGQIILNWVTESELDNAGFNILRSQSKQGPFVKVNRKLIQGAGTTGEWNTYTWTDTTAKPNVEYYYQIEDVSHAGKRNQLATVRLRGLVSAKGKLTTSWADLKAGH